MTHEQPNKISALSSLITLCEALNEPGMLRASVSPRSDAVARIRDLWLSSSTVRLLIYWGCFARDTIGPEEVSLVDYVENVRGTISSLGFSPCEIHVLFTDTHARLNGTEEQRIKSYGESMRLLVERQSWSMVALSDLVPPQTVHIDSGYAKVFEREFGILKRQANEIHTSPEGNSKAMEYLASNLSESAALLRNFPDSIFLHAGVSELNFLLPSIPRLYIYSGLRQSTQKPWFQPPDHQV